jgi:hypothetical protein
MRVTAFMFALDLAKTVVFDTVFYLAIRDFVPWILCFDAMFDNFIET